MATTTVTIPLTTLGTGSHDFGPTTVDPTVSTMDLLIDRTAGNKSLNSRSSGVTLTLTVLESTDGGTTWQQRCSATAVGGTYIDDETGQQINATEIVCPVYDAGVSGRQMKATILVAGGQVSLSGSLTLS